MTKNIAKQTEIRFQASLAHPESELNRELAAVPHPVVARARDFTRKHQVPRHNHPRDQLVYASRGVLTVITDDGTWVVPPQRAVWVPASTDHEVRTSGAASLRTLYIDPSATVSLSEGCCVVTVSPLLREMILHLIAMPVSTDRTEADARFIGVLLDQVLALPIQPLHLPAPNDQRLRTIAKALTETPADNRSLESWAASVGASARTIARLFLAETAMTFGQWRQQVRLLEALRRLAAGQSVTTVALDLGYESQSAFISMFRKAMGTTPGRYFRRYSQT